MKYLVFIFFFNTNAFAWSPLDHKEGVVYGVGLNTSIYRFPVEFPGQTKSKIDDSTTTVGPNINLGYDFLLWNSVTLGLRGEWMLADTSGMNKHKSSVENDHIKGKNRSLLGMLHLGYVTDFLGKNLVDEKYHMLFEFFLEGGLGAGRNDFTANYSYSNPKNGISEFYKESINETFNSRVLGGGVSVMTGAGHFLELRVLYQTFTANHKESKGSYQVNGGPVTPIASSERNTKPDPFTSVILTIGHHY